MKQLNRTNVQANKYPERIIQFGEGNFLRAFVDWIIFNMNQKAGFNSSVVIVQPLEIGMVNSLNEQDGLYHVNLQGLQNGKEVDSIQLIDVVSRGLNPYAQYDEFLKLAEIPEMRFVISNTTEAGIAFDPSCKLEDAPAKSYPGKLTQLLFHRFNVFNGAMDKGLIIFPCIDQYIELWNRGEDFKHWFDSACAVYCTLVDRIVPGYPRDSIGQILDRIGLDDKLVVKGEIFHLWVIEAPKTVEKEFPADKAGLNVLFVPCEKPYHDRKVTLLNGPHTVLSPVGYLAGLDTVKECCDDPVIGRFVKKVMFDELLETLDLPRVELTQFADAVLERFRNPFVKHFVTSIMLNSFPKFKTRDLPGLKIFLERKGVLPSGLVLGLAAIVTYYKGGKRGKDEIVLKDDPVIIELLNNLWADGSPIDVAKGVLGAEFIWGEDLNLIPGLTDRLTDYIRMIQDKGMIETVKSIL